MPGNASDILERAAQNGRLIVFCGAGVSMLPPSQAPGWWDIYQTATSALVARFLEGFPDFGSSLRAEELLGLVSTQTLADIIFTRFAGETFSELLTLVDVGDPNKNHEILAVLVATRAVTGIVTTNFDTMLERTISFQQRHIQRVIPGHSSGQGNTFDHPLLVKLHGSADMPESLKETRSHKLRKLAPGPSNYFRICSSSDALLVLGFSGADLELGITREFFDTWLSCGKPIVWVHRTKLPPSLPEFCVKNILFVQDELPDILIRLANSLAIRGERPQPEDRDGRKALIAGMDAWSRKPHIGRWGGATMLATLARHPEAGDNPTLVHFLEKLANRTAEQWQPGSAHTLEEIIDNCGATAFLSGMGMHQLHNKNCGTAKTLLKASLNILCNFHEILNELPRAYEPHRESNMNLSSSWINYGLAILLTEGGDAAGQAFKKGLGHAWCGGHTLNVLRALQNILDYSGAELSTQYKSALADEIVRIADQAGAFEPACEMRAILACYQARRGELWLAADTARTAVKLGQATQQPKSVLLARAAFGKIQMQHGDLAVGLRTISEASPDSNTALISSVISEVSAFLETLGIKTVSPFNVSISHHDLDATIALLQKGLHSENSEERLRFIDGCISKPREQVFSPEEDDLVAKVRKCTFEKDKNGAAEAGLKLSEQLLSKGQERPALWAACNVLKILDKSTLQFAQANALAGAASAQLGRLAEAEAFFSEAQQGIDTAVDVPHLLRALGYYLQKSSFAELNHSVTERIVKKLNSIIASSPIHEQGELTAKIGSLLISWDKISADLVNIFFEGLSTDHYVTAQKFIRPGPIRLFRGTTRYQPSSLVSDHLAKARSALDAGDVELTVKLVDELRSLPVASGEIDFGISVCLRIACDATKKRLQEIDAELDNLRTLLAGKMAFVALAMIESQIVRLGLLSNETEIAHRIIEERRQIVDLCLHPRIAARFGGYRSAFVQNGDDTQAESARLVAFFGIDNLELFQEHHACLC